VYPAPSGAPDQNADPGLLARIQNAADALTQRDPIRPVPDYYADPSQMPRETFGAQALKNIASAYSKLMPDDSIQLPGGVRVAPPAITGSMGHMGDLEKAFAESRVGRLVGNVKPWEMHPDDWVRHMRDNVDPQLLDKVRAMQQSGIGQTFPQGVNPRQVYSEITGARAADLAGSADPAEINRVLAKLRGIRAPNLEVSSNVQTVPHNELIGRDYPSARPRGRDFPEMPVYGDYNSETNTSRVFTFPKKVSMPGANQDNLIASTVAHELEHANDSQKGLLRPKTFGESLFDSFSGTENYRPGVVMGEVNAAAIPRGPTIWNQLQGPRASLLKQYGQTNGVPDRFAPARSPNNQYDLQWLNAQNPGAVARIGSRGHFATLDNFETDWALKNMAQQAMREGLDVNPAILQQFPDIKNTPLDIEKMLKQVKPSK
jgi:hypothetical protein